MRSPLSPQHDVSDVIVDLRCAVTTDPGAAMRGGLLAMRTHDEEAAMPLLRQAAGKFRQHAGLAQVFGLVARNLGDLRTACDALSHAHALAPTNALISHGLARARLEAGLPAIEDFKRAQRLAPTDGSVILGLAAARFADRDVVGAIAGIASVVEREPMWIEGQATLARLRRMGGGGDDEFEGYRAALKRLPGAIPLWSGLLALLDSGQHFADMPAVVAAARRAAPEMPELELYEAVAADELGDTDRAGALFDRLPGNDIGTIVRRTRSFLRRGRVADAAALAEAGVQLPAGRALWPYVALVWRLLDDPRQQWLEGPDDFVRVYDLGTKIGDSTALATRLRTLHIATAEPLDQSVRKGTQTDGPLLSRIDPEIRALRSAIEVSVADYISRLPPADALHPLLSAPRAPVRFAGSWSVRLTSDGYHSDHIHGQGWISSALYVSLPETLGKGGDAGWLTLGASRALLPDLAPFHRIEPKVGRLVLFPSTMWHGTNRFGAGERLTVAFDVARLG